MDLVSKPNLKPFRDYSEHEVINGFFSSNTVPLNKGTFVSIVPGNSGNVNVGAGSVRNHPATPLAGPAAQTPGVPNYAYSPRWEVKWKVKPAASGEVVLGMALYDTKEFNKYGESLAYQPYYERNEPNAVVSGEAVPIVRRGFFLTNNFVGNPSGGAGVTHIENGSGIVGPYVKGTSIGKFISAPDADGYALFLLEC